MCETSEPVVASVERAHAYIMEHNHMPHLFCKRATIWSEERSLKLHSADPAFTKIGAAPDT